MEKIKFKPLLPEQIEVRVAEAKYEGSCTALLYIDSRAAANILNEAVGEFNWQIEYKDVAGQIYGRLSIWDNERKIWVYKEDTGSESNIAAEKGMASDILKRCLVRWGCDYLYSSPKIKITCPNSYYIGGKMTMTFKVKDIEYEGKRITKLVISDRFGNEAFSTSKKTSAKGTNEPAGSNIDEKGSPDRVEALKAFCGALKSEEGINVKSLKKFYDFYSQKCDDFKYFNPEKLWNKWSANEREE